MLDKVNFSKIHRVFLELFLDFCFNGIIIKCIEQKLIVLNFSFIGAIPESKVNLLALKTHLLGHVGSLL